MRYALKFGYHGKNFSGYARQPNLRTVEREIIRASKDAKIITDKEPKVASRTDKGVSAVGNVIALNTDFRKDEIIPALNAHLDEIWFYGLAEVSDEFNPRHAKLRWYRYYLYDEGFELKNIQDTAKIFCGTHDFSNFARLEEKNPVRTMESIEVSKEKDFIILDFRAQSFLWNMVRRIVKAISDAAKGKLTKDEICEALESKQKMDFGVAEPEPLFLMDVKYDLEFNIDSTNFEKIRVGLRERLRELKIEELLHKQISKIDE